jgi:hypothetical protein
MTDITNQMMKIFENTDNTMIVFLIRALTQLEDPGKMGQWRTKKLRLESYLLGEWARTLSFSIAELHGFVMSW